MRNFWLIFGILILIGVVSSDSTGTELSYIPSTSYSPEAPSAKIVIHKFGEDMT